MEYTQIIPVIQTKTFPGFYQHRDSTRHKRTKVLNGERSTDIRRETERRQGMKRAVGRIQEDMCMQLQTKDQTPKGQFKTWENKNKEHKQNTGKIPNAQFHTMCEVASPNPF